MVDRQDADAAAVRQAEIAEEQLRLMRENTEQTVAGKEAQREDNRNSLQDRQVQARFGLAATYGSVATGLTELMMQPLDKEDQAAVAPLMQGAKVVSSMLFKLVEAHRTLGLVSEQLNRLDPNKDGTDPNAEGSDGSPLSRDSGIHVDGTGEPNLLQRIFTRARDNRDAGARTLSVKAGLFATSSLSGGPTGGTQGMA